MQRLRRSYAYRFQCSWPLLVTLWMTGQFGTAALAQPLGTAFTYQGRLENAGSPAGGLHDLRFRLYDAITVGAQVGATQCFDNVNVTDGLVTQSLDFGAQFTGQQRFLEVEVRADTGRDCTNSSGFIILVPRQALTATPYALQTRGLFVDNAGRVAIGTTTPINQLTIHGGLTLRDVYDDDVAFYAGNFYINNGGNDEPAYHYQSDPEQHEFFIEGGLTMRIAPDGNVGIGIGTSTPGARLHVQSASTTGIGVYGQATGGSSVNFGMFGQSDSTQGRGVYGQSTAISGFTYGGRFESASPTGRGVYGEATAGTGENYGGRFHSASTEGRGVYGVASAATGDTYGVWGQSASISGRGVYGEASASGGGTYGGYFESASDAGAGVFGSGGYGGLFHSPVPFGVGVYATANSDYSSGGWLVGGVYGAYCEATFTSGTTYGGYFVSASPDGRGVYAESNGPYGVYGRSAASSGTTHGVYGISYSPSGRGVMGESEDNIGVYGLASALSNSNYGVYGQSNSTSGRGVNGVANADTGTTYGVRGAVDSASGWGVYSSGNFGASGTKAFRIDHPDDPANKYLLHYAAESPEVINFYSETVTLDERGEAVVELPHYFAKINTRPRYQLTAVGAPMPTLHVAEKISESALSVGAAARSDEVAPLCSFRIAGGAPGGEVSWEVKAVRNDRWVQKRGAPVEVVKQDLERGTYQHPELYGQPPEKGMNYNAEREPDRETPAPPSPAAEHARVVREREME